MMSLKGLEKFILRKIKKKFEPNEKSIQESIENMQEFINFFSLTNVLLVRKVGYYAQLVASNNKDLFICPHCAGTGFVVEEKENQKHPPNISTCLFCLGNGIIKKDELTPTAIN